MTHTIRKATTHDAGPLADLAAVTFPLACPPSSSPEDIAAHLANTLSESHFPSYLADPDITILVIDADAGLRGYSLLVNRPAEDPDVAAALTLHPSIELSKCYVHPEHHGLGAAAELMHASLQAATAAGAAGIWLGVNSQNARAIRFYEKSGFRKVGSKSFRLGTTVEHDFVMERPSPIPAWPPRFSSKGGRGSFSSFSPGGMPSMVPSVPRAMMEILAWPSRTLSALNSPLSSARNGARWTTPRVKSGQSAAGYGQAGWAPQRPRPAGNTPSGTARARIFTAVEAAEQFRQLSVEMCGCVEDPPRQPLGLSHIAVAHQAGCHDGRVMRPY